MQAQFPEEIFVDGEKYMVLKNDLKDQVLYHVTKDGKDVCTIGLNENAAWEANNETNEELVRKLGEQIEHHEM